jgi:predicted RNase H-like HicB family nuclease
MSRMVWGFCSDLRRESADHVFYLEVRGVVEFGKRIEEAVERW